MKSFRIEQDIMGKVNVPKNSYYGNQTVRAAQNFTVSDLLIDETMNKSIIEIKQAAAIANRSILKSKSQKIVKACKHLLKNYDNYMSEFIIDVYQAGAGTPWHMNVNEVICNLALELSGHKKAQYEIINPHNDVNYGQSTNDVIPTAIRITTIKKNKLLIREIELLIKSFEKKGKEFKYILKSARTHLQDAVPITLGAEFNAWASDLKTRLSTIKQLEKNLHELHIGGTAAGTGLNAIKGFDKKVISELKQITKLQLKPTKNKIEKTQFESDFVDYINAVETFCGDLNKICNDLRLLASGPTTGLHEIDLPKVEPGSSIMPNKFNPSIAEMMNMICYSIIGNATTIRRCSEAGQLELNVMTPVIAHKLFDSQDILTNGLHIFRTKCIDGIKANKKQLKEYYEKNPTIATKLNPILGYDKTAQIIKKAVDKNKTIKQVLKEMKLYTGDVKKLI